MSNVLLILAAGKSSRFGGYPKALCDLGGTSVAQRTVNLASGNFDKVFLAINDEVYRSQGDVVHGCTTLSIPTGQGDAHSFLRAARLVRKECDAKTVTLCWGDTVYFDDKLFSMAAELSNELDDVVGITICSLDRDPYAWFEVEGNLIVRSHFRAIDGPIPEGIHDQSVFVFELEEVCAQLGRYMTYLGLDDGQDYVDANKSREMRLLDSFSYFRKSGMKPMKYALIEGGRSASFNTREELSMIREELKGRRG